MGTKIFIYDGFIIVPRETANGEGIVTYLLSAQLRLRGSLFLRYDKISSSTGTSTIIDIDYYLLQAPPGYGDLGKQCSDLLSKGFRKL